MKSRSDYENFLKGHAKLEFAHDSIWRVTTPIHAFKSIYTYNRAEDYRVVIYPHYSEEQTKSQLLHSGIRAREYAIANLIIPVGAKVHWDPYLTRQGNDYGKLRADKALVHSIVRKEDKQSVAFGVSRHDTSFVYLNKEAMMNGDVVVKPRMPFVTWRGTCASGIHFFLELDAALNY